MFSNLLKCLEMSLDWYMRGRRIATIHGHKSMYTSGSRAMSHCVTKRILGAVDKIETI